MLAVRLKPELENRLTKIDTIFYGSITFLWLIQNF